ncbi:MAG: HAMP domain-containing protein, partial [Gammaproteobacteria bacterium]
MTLRFTRSLIFKLTALYAVLFSLAFLLIFSTIYYLVAGALLESTDEELREDQAEMETAYRKGGIEGLKAYIAREMADDGPEEKWIRVLKATGEVVAASDGGAWGDIPAPRAVPALESFTIPNRPHLRARAIAFRTGDFIVQEAVPMGWDAALLGRLRDAFLTGALLALILSLSSGWFIARRTLAQIRKIDDVALRIARSNDLSQRVPLRGAGDELDRLAATFNAMLKRLEAFVRELSDMMDNTVHDFKTPLARIRTMAESSLQNPDPREVQEVLVQIMEESDRFLSLLHAIMDISEARTGLIAL